MTSPRRYLRADEKRRDWERSNRRGFTLLEILVVLALIAVIMAVALPPVFKALKKPPIIQAMNSLEEGCRRARMLAIMSGKPAELHIQEGSLKVQAVTDIRPSEAGSAGGSSAPTGTPAEAPIEGEVVTAPEVPAFSATLPEDVAFKQLVINRRDMMDDSEARVRFYPNGTCDAFTATLLSTANEERTMTLEISTGRESWVVIR